MPYKIDERVVHPTYGVGRIVGLVAKRFEAEERQFYEVAIERSTVWVPVDDSRNGNGNGLRPLTPKADLNKYRRLLQSSPKPLTQDPRQRKVDLQDRMKIGTFQAMCETVRDITARGWYKPLSEADTALLRKAREGLCQEWAVSAEISVVQATAEVNALLQAGRQAHQAQPAA
jgi:CarD family transcriptional regulator